MSVVAIIAGAGSGTRFGSPQPKALIELAGIPLVVHAVRAMRDSGSVNKAIVTAPADSLAVFSAVLTKAGFFEHGDFPVRVVCGGTTRQASVFEGLKAAGSPRYVLIHDAARALTPPDMINRVVSALHTGNTAVIPAIPVVDTIKEVGTPHADGSEPITQTLERSRLRAVQTPQGFDFAALYEAHTSYRERANSEETAASDDATLMEEKGHTIVTVPGSQNALKITYPLDLAICEIMLGAR